MAPVLSRNLGTASIASIHNPSVSACSSPFLPIFGSACLPQTVRKYRFSAGGSKWGIEKRNRAASVRTGAARADKASPEFFWKNSISKQRQELPPLSKTPSCNFLLSSMIHGFSRFRNALPTVPFAMKMAEGNFDEPKNLNSDKFLGLFMHFLDAMPQPIKIFPWRRTMEGFIEILFQLVFAVAKFLAVPLLALSSLSEMSYCAQERKLIFVPILLLAGFSFSGVLKDTAMELSPELKSEEIPWHLLLTAIFFILLKLPGPSYPYWARIIIPHFANGALWRTLWFAFLWYKKPQGQGPLMAGAGAQEDGIQSEKKN